MPYDAYLAHASENGTDAKRLAEALRARGLTVWFNRFIVGPSIREQMEAGLLESDFGIVMLSPEFFSKKWTRNELDALMGLESPGEVRILPVWWNTTETNIRTESPMLAMRSAAVLGEAGVEGVADALVESILALSSDTSPGKRLRLQIATGFRWTDGPVWMPASLAEYDRRFGEDFAITDLAHIGYEGVAPAELEARDRGQPVPLIELFRAHTFWDGRLVTVIARQVAGSVQVFEGLVRDEDLPVDPTRPPGGCMAAYVFQLETVDFTRGELATSTASGRTRRRIPAWDPTRPMTAPSAGSRGL
ncbi:MAG TPA: toll/interleukin-1 receptor domain-containing protein [Acidimicrobiales bacterium]|nr:toll/interleukin-1 receptor domain-containing protein [Acidimicrobiales bacterium]